MSSSDAGRSKTETTRFEHGDADQKRVVPRCEVEIPVDLVETDWGWEPLSIATRTCRSPVIGTQD